MYSETWNPFPLQYMSQSPESWLDSSLHSKFIASHELLYILSRNSLIQPNIRRVCVGSAVDNESLKKESQIQRFTHCKYQNKESKWKEGNRKEREKDRKEKKGEKITGQGGKGIEREERKGKQRKGKGIQMREGIL